MSVVPVYTCGHYAAGVSNTICRVELLCEGHSQQRLSLQYYRGISAIDVHMYDLNSLCGSSVELKYVLFLYRWKEGKEQKFVETCDSAITSSNAKTTSR